MQSGLVGGELGGHLGGSLDYPQVEDLGLHHQAVLISDALQNLVDGILGISGHDTVHEGAVHSAGVLEPVFESFRKLPQLDVFLYAFFQFLSVQEDKLAGEDDQSLVGSALEVLPAVVQELDQLAGVGGGGGIVKPAGGVEGDAGLGRVGDYEAYLRLLGQFHICVEVAVRVDAAADDVYHLYGVHLPALIDALKVQVVESVLLVEHVHHAFLNGLYYHY